MQLVDLVDRVLEMLEAEPDFAFTLDGQLATIDDYLEIRPEQAERLRGHVRSGRLAIGPWQILMDEFLVSGRDARPQPRGGLGSRDRLRRADARRLPARHVRPRRPDAADPAPRRRRPTRSCGAASRPSVDRHAFRWESPDGSWVRAEYLPAGYGNAAGMFAVPDRLEAAADALHEWARPWFGDDPVLAMYGTDHAAPESRAGGARRPPQRGARVDRTCGSARWRSTWRGAGADRRRPVLARRDALRRTRQRAHGRGERANRHQAGRGTRRDAAGALRGAAHRAPRRRRRLARPLPGPGVGQAHRELGTRLDLRLQHRPGRRPGARPLRRGRAGRHDPRPARGGHRRGGGAARGASRSSTRRRRARTGLVEAELPIPADWESVALELPGRHRAWRPRSCDRKEPILFDESMRGPTRSTTCFGASTAARSSTTPGTATGSRAAP